MSRLLAWILVTGIGLAGCAAPRGTAGGCYVEAGWLDSSNGCSERAGYPDCYRVCPDGSRVRVQNLGDAPRTPTGASPPQPGASQPPGGTSQPQGSGGQP